MLDNYDFPDFSPKLENYFSDFHESQKHPWYSYRLSVEHGYWVFCIIVDALGEI